MVAASWTFPGVYIFKTEAVIFTISHIPHRHWSKNFAERWSCIFSNILTCGTGEPDMRLQVIATREGRGKWINMCTVFVVFLNVSKIFV